MNKVMRKEETMQFNKVYRAKMSGKSCDNVTRVGTKT